ncbi:conserved hypothetical protein [Histoplasma capsulatum H143]|uniref:Uncharacterized protein n=1 Tax=Ajellomyces capsulatus (strain H143) TaxID=544712 RepID=C6HHW2_AJECH|nr:conserved hypothetical protein [Histoplasma capsulatum H143]
MGLIGRLLTCNIHPQTRPDRQRNGCAVTKVDQQAQVSLFYDTDQQVENMSGQRLQLPGYMWYTTYSVFGSSYTAHLVQIRGEYSSIKQRPRPHLFFATAVTFLKCLISELTSPKFTQPLLIFLSVAGALGVTAGISLHFSSGYMHQLLDIRTGGEDNDYTTKKRKFIVDNGSSSNNDLTHPRQKTRDGRMYTTSAGSNRASLRDIMTAQNKPWLARNRNEEQTAMTSLWQVPAFKNERKEETKRDDESEIESEQVPRGERDREDLLATIILEEEEDDDYGEGEGEGEEEDNEI